MNTQNQVSKESSNKKLGYAKNHKAAQVITKLPFYEVKRAVAEGCPAFKPNGTVDCDELVRWVADNPPKDEDDGALNIHVERAKDIRANRMLKEQKYAEKAKQLLPKEKVKHCWFRNVISAKTKIYNADNQASVEIGMKLGLQPEQVDLVREILSKHRRLAIKELHQGEFGKVECPECRKEIKEV